MKETDLYEEADQIVPMSCHGQFPIPSEKATEKEGKRRATKNEKKRETKRERLVAVAEHNPNNKLDALMSQHTTKVDKKPRTNKLLTDKVENTKMLTPTMQPFNTSNLKQPPETVALPSINLKPPPETVAVDIAERQLLTPRTGPAPTAKQKPAPTKAKKTKK